MEDLYIKRSLVIVGGGPAGLAAAVAATDAGLKDVLIIERDDRLGGILNQCIHNGFGLHRFKEELTGPEYAARFIKEAEERNIDYKLETIVLDISVDADGTKLVTMMNSEEGTRIIKADAVILAMGCRERPRGALGLPGYRPAGIYTAGTAQRLVNIEGKMIGRRVVILGSGDIGLIMARRMTLEGAEVLAVSELMPYSGGLQRNIVQCLKDFDIPLLLSHTVSKIYGKERVEGIDISEVDASRKIIPGTAIHFECDTLLLSCGLLPENELSRSAGVEISGVTGGPVVRDNLETSVPGVFACGNVLHVHDLVDYVSAEAERAGKVAAEYVKQAAIAEAMGGSGADSNAEDNAAGGGVSDVFDIKCSGGIRYSVPQKVCISEMDDRITIRFRVGDVLRNKKLCLMVAGEKKLELKKNVMEPGKMEELNVKKDMLSSLADIKDLAETGNVPIELTVLDAEG
ncbi:MAG: FAD-dependent oxidoreductase [Eubacterium sp.]|nr:FAD-dependent oxidoreductase [Eubacterium sp.]